MKIQYLAVIFLIIILPMTLILTVYNQSQINNLDLQLKYNTYLSDATHDAISAFQLNTVNNSYSEVADSLKRDVEASVNVFLNSMASSLGTSGATPEAISEYVPAILFTLYDGYYIYAPAYTDEYEEKKDLENDNEVIYEFVETNFSHVVKPYVYYTMRYKVDDNNDFMVNYTLDNYITIYGKINGKYVTKAGYLSSLDTDKKLVGVNVKLDTEKLATILKHNLLKYKVSEVRLRQLDNKDNIDTAYGEQDFSILEKVEFKNLNEVKEFVEPDAGAEILKSYNIMQVVDFIKSTILEESDVQALIQYISTNIGAQVLEGNTLNDVVEYLNLNEIQWIYLSNLINYLNETYNGEIINYKDYLNSAQADFEQLTDLIKYLEAEVIESYRTSLISNMGEKLLDLILNNKANDITLQDIPLSKLVEKLDAPIDYSGEELDEVIDCFTVTYTGDSNDTTDDKKITDSDSKLYYVKTLQFSKWVNENLKGIEVNKAVNSKGESLDSFKDKTDKIFNTMRDDNNPEELTSDFSQHKIEVIKESIQSNLTASIARYNQQVFGIKHGYDLKMPVLNELEWETITNRVTMVTFMQGMIIGNKVFNDYAVVSSERNKEVIDTNQIYYFDTSSSGITYYHKFDCPKLSESSLKNVIGYKAIEYEVYKEEKNNNINYYFGEELEKKLEEINNRRLLACYDCLVNCNYESVTNEELLYSKFEAIGRERNKNYKVNSYMDTEL